MESRLEHCSGVLDREEIKGEMMRYAGRALGFVGK